MSKIQLSATDKERITHMRLELKLPYSQIASHFPDMTVWRMKYICTRVLKISTGIRDARRDHAQDEQVKILLALGLNDTQIAARMDVCRQRIHARRKRLKLNSQRETRANG